MVPPGCRLGSRHRKAEPPKTPASLCDAPMPGFVAGDSMRHVKLLDLVENAVLGRTSRGRAAAPRLLQRAGRHTFAGTALAQGAPMVEVSRWLGHKSITTTLDLHDILFRRPAGGHAMRLTGRSCPLSFSRRM
jgi:hypothetical protein